MPVHQVSYDLNAPGKDYEGLLATLRRYDHHHILDSTWLVAGAVTAQQIFEAIRPFIDNGDRVFISRVSSDWAGWLPKDVWEWLRGNA